VDLESEPVAVELERAVLIGDRNPDELDAADHGNLLGRRI
jgi:hypothetical protein